jgi:phage FluMu protein Com
MADQHKNTPNYLISVLQNKCPRCREGNLFITKNAYDFTRNTKMNEHCPTCGQVTEIEVGFYYGTAYVSYGLTVAFSVATFVAWWVLIGVSIDDNRLFWWLGINSFLMLAMQPLFMRLSRSLWLSWFVKYDANWQISKPKDTERVIKEHMNNW